MLALGGSAALIADRLLPGEPRVVILPNGSQIEAEGSTDIALLADRITELEYQLATVTAERDNCVSELSALQAACTRLETKMNDAENLLALWEEHDRIGLDDLVRTGLVVVGTALAAVTGIAATLSSGLEIAQTAINKFVNAFSGPSAGIRWLTAQVSTLISGIDNLLEQMGEAVEPTNSVTTMVGSFVIWILERLPFGSGTKARAGMEAMESLVNQLPVLIDGIQDDVLEPLADWFSNDTRVNLPGTLTSPITLNVFDPAIDILESVSQLKTKFENDFDTPVQAALDQRTSMREQIITTRQTTKSV
jgi:hypothetical protein